MTSYEIKKPEVWRKVNGEAQRVLEKRERDDLKKAKDERLSVTDQIQERYGGVNGKGEAEPISIIHQFSTD